MDKIREIIEHIRIRPGMYAGCLGDGENKADALYSLMKEIINNSVDEFYAGHGDEIIVNATDKEISVRDFGRGIPLDEIEHAASDSEYRGETSYEKRTIGFYNGFGLKVVNALSSHFHVASFRQGQCAYATFASGIKVEEGRMVTEERDGTLVRFMPDEEFFHQYAYRAEFIESIVREYTYLHQGIRIILNGTEYKSDDGLLGLFLEEHEGGQFLYPPIHIKDNDIEMVLAHSDSDEERILSCVNGHITTDGGRHASAFRKAAEDMLTTYFEQRHGKTFKAIDIHPGITGAIGLWISRPIFCQNLRTKLASTHMGAEEDSQTIISYVSRVMEDQLTKHMNSNPDVARCIMERIVSAKQQRIG